MPIPLPKELRSRVIDAFEAGLGSMTETAERFSVSVSCVSRWVRLKSIYGEANPKPHAGGRNHKIADCHLDKLQKIVEEKPDLTLDELTMLWNAQSSIKVCRSSINRALSRAKMTFKKNFSINGTRQRIGKRERKKVHRGNIQSSYM